MGVSGNCRGSVENRFYHIFVRVGWVKVSANTGYVLLRLMVVKVIGQSFVHSNFSNKSKIKDELYKRG